MEVGTLRQASSDAVPSAKFLQARITALSTTLIKRLENILAAALEETRAGPTDGDAAAAQLPPTLPDTAVQQLQLDVESTAVVRAAEEIMTLTRTLKEIWLFGELDTLEKDHDGQDNAAARKKMDQDVRVVEEGFKKFLEKYETTL